MSGKNRSKKGFRGKPVKLPEGPVPLKKCSDLTLIKDKSEKVIEFVDNMLSSGWESYCSRPRADMLGYYAVCRWYPKNKSWAVLYVGHGQIRACLDHHFSSHKRTPIGNYLSSFPKESRNLLWIKWLKDPFYPYKGLDLSDVLDVVQHRYNCGEQPAFNLDFDIQEEQLPSDFSIVPDWNKSKKKAPTVPAT